MAMLLSHILLSVYKKRAFTLKLMHAQCHDVHLFCDMNLLNLNLMHAMRNHVYLFCNMKSLMLIALMHHGIETGYISCFVATCTNVVRGSLRVYPCVRHMLMPDENTTNPTRSR